MKQIINWFANKPKNFIPLVILTIVVVLLSLLIINQITVNRKLRSTIDVMNVDASNFSVKHNKDSTTIYQQNQLLFTKDQIITKLKLDTATKGLKRIRSAVKTQQSVEISKLEIPKTNDTTETVLLSGDSSCYVVLDSSFRAAQNLKYWHQTYNNLDSFSISNPYISMQFHIDTSYNLIMDNGRLTNRQTIIVADKKLGFLKTPKPIVQITNSNPYFKINSIQNGQVIYKEPIYKKPLVWAILGALIGGYAVSKF